MQQPTKELDQQFEAALVVLRDLHTRAIELSVKDILSAARRAHDALIDCKLARDE
jgi:hypothetical protein